MHVFVSELRFAGRSLVANPGFTLVVMLYLALGIGANAAVFDGVFLQPLPYPEPDSRVHS